MNNRGRFFVSFSTQRNRLIVWGVISIVFMSNLGAIIDLLLHPEIEYFDVEHIIVGLSTALVLGIILVLLIMYIEYLEKAFRDISQSEEALRESEQRFSTVFKSNPVAASLRTLADGRCMDVNEAYLRMSGFSREELVNQSVEFGGWNTPADRKQFAERLAKKQYIKNVEFEFKTKSGQPRYVVASYEKIQVDGEDCVLALFQDITERKQVENALKESEEKFRILNTLAPAGIYLTDPEGNCLYTNPRWNEMAGFSSQAALGKGWINGLHPDDRETVSSNWKKMIESEGSWGLEYRFQTPEGKVTWVYGLATPQRDALGKIVQFVGLNMDITERKLAEHIAQQYADELELRVEERTVELLRASRIKDEFLANMSHELRTPLNSILGFSETLMEGTRGRLTPRQGEAVKFVYSSGRHLLGLINDILDLSKIEADKFDLYPDSMLVNDLCLASLAFVSQMAQKKSVKVEYVRQPQATRIFADPKRLKQILVNLLNNAVKFTPETGMVKLEVQADAARGLMRFIVSDSGIGISAEDLEKLFKPFVQLDSSLSRRYDGSGLGLALVKNMVELHGGTVELESEVGRGSRFTVSLPWDPQDPQQPADSALESDSQIKMITLDKGQHKILLAEDNENNILMVQDYLEYYGYQVIVARDGMEALDLARENSPDLILMDSQMPKLDGKEATLRLRADPKFASVPIIALTTLAVDGEGESLMAAGANEYLSRPFSLQGLMEMIEGMLPPAP